MMTTTALLRLPWTLGLSWRKKENLLESKRRWLLNPLISYLVNVLSNKYDEASHLRLLNTET